LILLTGIASHITTNFRPFKDRFELRGTQVSIASFFGRLRSLPCFPGELTTRAQLRRPIERALIDAPLSALASLSNTPQSILIGSNAASNQSVRDQAQKYGLGTNGWVGIVFLFK
jgi:hypothetical protein